MKKKTTRHPKSSTSRETPSTDPSELDRFIESLPDWLRKTCNHGFSSNLTQADLQAYNENLDYACRKLDEFQSVARRSDPKVWRRYGRLFGAMKVPIAPQPGGRPREEDFVDEAIQLKQSGRSWAQVAIAINAKQAKGP